jgi:NAD(P)-dependent dehydrogenase (short-subunit alcohol dehydrogenase family)
LSRDAHTILLNRERVSVTLVGAGKIAQPACEFCERTGGEGLRDLKGKTAFVTGGASGIGLELTRLFLKEGMNVAIADIEETALAKAPAALQADESRLRGFVCDTADRASLHRAADAAIAAFGPVHVVCNNAGVGSRPDGIAELTERQWEWVLSVNLMGVVHGIAVFLPHMRAHGEGGHFLNTASMAGMLGQPNDGPYSASKAAVVGVSESLFYELRDTNIGVSVLCPGFARTGIALSERNAPKDLAQEAREPLSEAGAGGAAQSMQAIAGGIAPAEVAARALQGIVDGDLYVFTHPDMRPMLQKRLARINAAYDKAERFVFKPE